MKSIKNIKIKLIKSEEDYNEALVQIYHLMDAKEGTPELDVLEVLSMLVEQYEDRHFPIAEPDPVEAIKYRMEQQGLNATALGRVLGHKSRATEILHRTRKLTLPMIRNVSRELSIPAELLVKEY